MSVCKQIWSTAMSPKQLRVARFKQLLCGGLSIACVCACVCRCVCVAVAVHWSAGAWPPHYVPQQTYSAQGLCFRFLLLLPNDWTRNQCCKAQHASPCTHCRVLPPGKFSGMIPEPLSVYAESIMMMSVTVFKISIYRSSGDRLLNFWNICVSIYSKTCFGRPLPWTTTWHLRPLS